VSIETPVTPTNVSFPRLEEDTLKFWKERGVYEQSLARRADAPRFVFYEGPPTANGMPHPGHCLTRAKTQDEKATAKIVNSLRERRPKNKKDENEFKLFWVFSFRLCSSLVTLFLDVAQAGTNAHAIEESFQFFLRSQAFG